MGFFRGRGRASVGAERPAPSNATGYPPNIQRQIDAALAADGFSLAPQRAPEGKSFLAAVPTKVGAIKLPSKTEARVLEALERLYPGRVRRPRALNLWSSAPDDQLKPGEFRPDFAVLADTMPARPAFYVDAKSGTWRSPEWRRGVQAFKASHHEPIYEWNGLGPFPEHAE